MSSKIRALIIDMTEEDFPVVLEMFESRSIDSARDFVHVACSVARRIRNYSDYKIPLRVRLQSVNDDYADIATLTV